MAHFGKNNVGRRRRNTFLKPRREGQHSGLLAWPPSLPPSAQMRKSRSLISFASRAVCCHARVHDARGAAEVKTESSHHRHPQHNYRGKRYKWPAASGGGSKIGEKRDLSIHLYEINTFTCSPLVSADTIISDCFPAFWIVFLLMGSHLAMPD